MSNKEIVRERYGRSATTLDDAPDGTPPTLGLGDPVAFADLQPGETVLDLGSGPGRDLFNAAAIVGPTGRAIGVDMTPEMLERSRAKAPANAAIIEGDLERLPLHCGAVDVVISNCVINLVDDKRRALVEAYRVLRAGGRLAILDTAFETEPPTQVREDGAAWCGCVGGALVASDYEALLNDIGYEDVSVAFESATCGEGDVQARAVRVTATKPGDAKPDIRPAVASDRPAFEALLADAGLPQGLRTEDAVVALDGDTVVGVIAVERFGYGALLRSLAVADGHAGRGLGSKLVIAALEIARWSGAEVVYLLALRTELFERFGFEQTELSEVQRDTPSGELGAFCTPDAIPMRLDFERADLPLLGKPSRKQLPTFQDGSCC